MSEKQNVAFVGLGVMGFPMAGHLAAAGHQVTVYNRTASRAEAWVAKHGGKSSPQPADAAKGASIVFVCVGNDDDLRSVVFGDKGALAGMAVAPSWSTTRRHRPKSRARFPPRPRGRGSASWMRRSPAARPAPRTAS